MFADINNLPNSLNGDFRMAVFAARGGCRQVAAAVEESAGHDGNCGRT
jgi:hypothetical protein